MTLADDIVNRIDYDFAALGVPKSVVCQTSLRAKMLDDRVRSREDLERTLDFPVLAELPLDSRSRK